MESGLNLYLRYKASTMLPFSSTSPLSEDSSTLLRVLSTRDELDKALGELAEQATCTELLRNYRPKYARNRITITFCNRSRALKEAVYYDKPTTYH